LIADLFDTLFQKDPVMESFQSDRMYYSHEGFVIKAEECNSKWTREVIPKVELIYGIENVTESMKEEIFERPIVNSGLIAGGVKPCLQHLSFMMKMGSFVTWAPYCLDQPFLNIGLGLGLARFRYQIDPPNSTFLGTVALLLLRDPNAMGKEMGSFTRDGRIPDVIHQFNRSPLMRDVSRSACPGSLW
jgi:hypothetical protein